MTDGRRGSPARPASAGGLELAPRRRPEPAGSSALLRLESSCELAYAGAPDPAAVVRSLSSPGDSEAGLRVALHLAAVFPLPRSSREGAARPWGLSAFEGAPAGCPAALRALRSLRDRRPAFARTGEFVAALLRQGGPRGELLQQGEPPTPENAPFEPLADLVMQLPELTARLLEPWGDLPSARPGPWELFHHRRHETPWRRRLLRRGAGSREETIAWAALLGEREPQLRLPAAGSGVIPWYPALSSPDAQQLAAAVRRQLEPGADVDVTRLPALAIDPALVRRLLLRVDAASLSADRRGLPEAVAAIRGLDLPLPLRRAVTWQLLERGVDGTLLAGVAGSWLPGCTWGLPELPPGLALRLGVVPELRELVVGTLGRLESEQWNAWFERLEAAPGSAGIEREPFLDALTAHWCLRELDRWALLGPALLERLCSAVLLAGPAPAVRLYESLGSAIAASAFLDRMLAAFGGAALAPHLEPPPDREPELAARRRWLAAAVEAPQGLAIGAPRRTPGRRGPRSRG